MEISSLVFILSVGGIVIEVALDIDEGSSLIARARSKVAKRTDKVGKLSGGCSLGRHITNKVIVLLLDLALDSFLKGIARNI